MSGVGAAACGRAGVAPGGAVGSGGSGSGSIVRGVAPGYSGSGPDCWAKDAVAPSSSVSAAARRANMKSSGEGFARFVPMSCLVRKQNGF
jgi:hypothetical protein